MKFLKLVLAVAALAFVVAHAIEIPKLLESGPINFATSKWLAKGASMIIGAAIAIKLFSSALRTQHEE